MPTVFTHGLVGLGAAELFPAANKPLWFWGLSLALAAAPDLDVLAFSFHIPYSSLFGHRGFFHSLVCALVVGFGVAGLTCSVLGLPWWWLGFYFFGVTASHGILDGFTNGGLGIAYFSPLDTRRYFFPWQPIQVSPLGMGFFSAWGWRALRSEILWVWLPLAVVLGAAVLGRPWWEAGISSKNS